MGFLEVQRSVSWHRQISAQSHKRGGQADGLCEPLLYIGPIFEFSTIVDRALRAELAEPTFFFVALTMGVEF